MDSISQKPRARYDDAASLPARVERVVRLLDEFADHKCPACEVAVCGHEVLFSIVAGHEEKPLCMQCLSREIRRDMQDSYDQMTSYIFSKECLNQGWRLVNAREKGRRCVLTVMSPPDAAGDASDPSDSDASDPSRSEAPDFDASWDAGDLGCGELVLDLRKRLQAMASETVLRLRATDLGAPEDLPAWCRLTGHTLIFQQHPFYFIQRKRTES